LPQSAAAAWGHIRAFLAPLSSAAICFACRCEAVRRRCACCALWRSTPPASSSASACCWRWRRRQRGVQCLRCTPRWAFFRAQGRRACSVRARLLRCLAC
jgi:hypothetical protein